MEGKTLDIPMYQVLYFDVSISKLSIPYPTVSCSAPTTSRENQVDMYKTTRERCQN